MIISMLTEQAMTSSELGGIAITESANSALNITHQGNRARHLTKSTLRMVNSKSVSDRT